MVPVSMGLEERKMYRKHPFFHTNFLGSSCRSYLQTIVLQCHHLCQEKNPNSTDGRLSLASHGISSQPSKSYPTVEILRPLGSNKSCICSCCGTANVKPGGLKWWAHRLSKGQWLWAKVKTRFHSFQLVT